METKQVIIFLIIPMLLPITGCEEPADMEFLEYWEKIEGIEELTLMDEIEYRGTLNVFCPLNPESKTQQLVAEHLTIAYNTSE